MPVFCGPFGHLLGRRISRLWSVRWIQASGRSNQGGYHIQRLGSEMGTNIGRWGAASERRSAARGSPDRPGAIEISSSGVGHELSSEITESGLLVADSAESLLGFSTLVNGEMCCHVLLLKVHVGKINLFHVFFFFFFFSLQDPQKKSTTLERGQTPLRGTPTPQFSNVAGFTNRYFYPAFFTIVCVCLLAL